MKRLFLLLSIAALSSCASKYVLTTTKKYVYHGGNAAHFQKRAELKAEKKAMKEYYGKH